MNFPALLADYPEITVVGPYEVHFTDGLNFRLYRGKKIIEIILERNLPYEITAAKILEAADKLYEREIKLQVFGELGD